MFSWQQFTIGYRWQEQITQNRDRTGQDSAQDPHCGCRLVGKITKLSDRQNRSHLKNSQRVFIFYDSTQKTYVPIYTKVRYIHIYLYIFNAFGQLTCSRSRSSAQMAACFQSIFDSNGNTQALDKSTGMQPACNASRNLQKWMKNNQDKKAQDIYICMYVCMGENEMGMSCKMKIVFYLKEPKRRPRGTKQNVEFWSSVS